MPRMGPPYDRRIRSLLKCAFSLLVAVLSAAASVTAAVTAAPVLSDLASVYSASLQQLLLNVPASYARDAYASPYILWSPSAFPIALGNADSSSLPVVAAVELPTSRGRVVAFGHEGIPGSCCSADDGWDKLTMNAVRWMAAGKASLQIASPGAWWANTGIPGVNAAMTDIKIKTSTMSLDAFAAGGWKNIDVYWIDTYTEYSPGHIEALLTFVNQTGKGLLVGGHAWYWSYFHQNANIFTDLSVNQVLWPLGLAVSTEVQIGFQPAPASPPPAWLCTNTLYLASTLVAVKTGSATFSDVDLYPAANAAINLLLKNLPSRARDAASGLTSVWSLLEAARSTAGIRVGPNSPLDPRNGYPGDVLDVAIEVSTIRRGDLTGLKPSHSAAAYPGATPANAAKVTVTVTINGTYNRPPYRFGDDGPAWRSTGLYAPPGQQITLTLRTPGAVGKGLQVQIGAHTDDLTFKDSWRRLPYAVSRFSLDASVTAAGNPLGGMVFILVPNGLNLGAVTVTISNAVRSPYFRLGSTPTTNWKNTIRSYPGPWAELDSGKFVIMLPSSAIRTLADPTPVLAHWNLVMDSMAWLANMPAERDRPERFLVDADIGGGWMHAGYPIMAYDEPVVHKELLDLKQLRAKGAWGPYHELGHNHQWSDMQFSGTGESFNNLWTIYALEKTRVPSRAWENWPMVSPDGRANLRSEYFKNGAKWDRDWNVWVALDTYLQLKEGFGWEFYRKMYAMYQKFPQTLPADNVQTWIQTSCHIAGVNLVPFYTKWGFPVATETTTACAKLPSWSANPFDKNTTTNPH